MDVSYFLLSGRARTRVTDIVWESVLLRIRAAEVFKALSFLPSYCAVAVVSRTGSGRTSACANGGRCCA